MKKCLTFLFFVLLNFMLFSCAVKKINPLEYEKTKIVFGSGGGFAGTENSYMLLDNGRIYKLSKMGQEYSSLGRLRLNEAKQIFHTYNLLNFGEMELNEPGNMYKYLEFDLAGNKHRMTWGNGKEDKNLSTMHAILMNHVKSLVSQK